MYLLDLMPPAYLVDVVLMQHYTSLLTLTYIRREPELGFVFESLIQSALLQLQSLDVPADILDVTSASAQSFRFKCAETTM